MRHMINIIIFLSLITYITGCSTFMETAKSGWNKYYPKKVEKPQSEPIRDIIRSEKQVKSPEQIQEESDPQIGHYNSPESDEQGLSVQKYEDKDVVEDVENESLIMGPDYLVQLAFFEQPFNTTKKRMVYLPENIELMSPSGIQVRYRKNADNNLILDAKLTDSDIEYFIMQAQKYYCTGDINYQIYYTGHNIDKDNKTILVKFLLSNKNKRYLMIYYPLQYSTSYRSKIIDENQEIALKMDIALRNFVTTTYNNRSYDDIIIRFSTDKEIFLSKTGISGINSFLFFDRNVYDEGPEYLWTNDLLSDDYINKNIHRTTNNIDIIYFDSISSPSRARDKFNKIKNAQLFFVNFLYKDRDATNKEFKFNKNIHHGRVGMTLSLKDPALHTPFNTVFNLKEINRFFGIED